MNLGGVENKARLALTLFVLALLLTIGLSLALYSQARRELNNERTRHVKLETALLASFLPHDQSKLSDALLLQHLHRAGISGAAAVYGTEGRLVARASTLDPLPDPSLLTPKFYAGGRTSQTHVAAMPASSITRTEEEFEVAELAIPGSYIIVLARTTEGQSSPAIFYVFSYQVIALVFGLILLLLAVRWLLRPYRRMVEAARGSPVRASPGGSESEFVVETFQALIQQLQTKERELAQLHVVERNRAERSERFSERLIANIPSGLVTIRAAGEVASANTYAQEMFGLFEPASSNMRNGPYPEVFRKLAVDFRTFFKPAPKMVALVSECLEQGTSFRREEVEVTDADGRVRHLGLSISPITDSLHHVEAALCLMTDITEVIELRERMKLQESLANLGEMAAGLAHEFKNSLATLHGYVQLLDGKGTGPLREEQRRRTLSSMLNEVRLLARLVTDFLNFAKPQQLNLAQVDLRVVIESCAEEIWGQLKQAGIAFKIEGTFATLAADEALLKRAFANLLRNAAEAIDPQCQQRVIEVSGTVDTGRGKRYAHVLISDTGVGIPEDNLRRIFIPFFTTKSRGYGIGLALVQKILVAHGGGVSVERSDGTGTVFHCRLPLGTGDVLWKHNPTS